MSRSQWILAVCGGLAGVNAVRQALFATAAVSPWLATLSGAVAILSAVAFVLLRRRHWAAAPALLTFGVALPLATILGTEPLLGDALPLTLRLPGYLAAATLGLLAAWGGLRELARARSLQERASAPTLPSATSSLDANSVRPSHRIAANVPDSTVTTGGADGRVFSWRSLRGHSMERPQHNLTLERKKSGKRQVIDTTTIAGIGYELEATHVGWRSDQRECELSGIRMKMAATYGSDQ
jgi:hypothetical protein